MKNLGVTLLKLILGLINLVLITQVWLGTLLNLTGTARLMFLDFCFLASAATLAFCAFSIAVISLVLATSHVL